jgi:hypothetical protein
LRRKKRKGSHKEENVNILLVQQSALGALIYFEIIEKVTHPSELSDPREASGYSAGQKTYEIQTSS